jgi:hypothetical protein
MQAPASTLAGRTGRRGAMPMCPAGIGRGSHRRRLPCRRALAVCQRSCLSATVSLLAGPLTPPLRWHSESIPRPLAFLALFPRLSSAPTPAFVRPVRSSALHWSNAHHRGLHLPAAASDGPAFHARRPPRLPDCCTGARFPHSTKSTTCCDGLSSSPGVACCQPAPAVVLRS